MRAALVAPLVVIAALSCATPHEQWGPDEDQTAPKTPPPAPAPGNAPPPVSLVVPPSGEGEAVMKTTPPPVIAPSPGRSRTEEAAQEAEEEQADHAEADQGQAGETPSPRHDIPVISENDAPSIVIDSGQPRHARLPASPLPATPPPTTPPDETTTAGTSGSDSVFIYVPTEKKGKHKHRRHHRHRHNEEGAVAQAPPPAEPAPEIAPAGTESGNEAEQPEANGNDNGPPIGMVADITPAGSAPPKPDPTLHRAKDWTGISITGGLGVFLSSGTEPGYKASLAYGGQVAISPRFAGDFALDLSFWRTGISTGSGFESVAGSENEIGGRIMYLPRIGLGFFTGVGLGFDMTWTTAAYSLEGAAAGSASQFRPGGEANFSLGWRISYFEVRMDVRAILSGGLRLDYLPDLAVGVTF